MSLIETLLLYFLQMVQKPIPNRIQKTTVFIVIALATFGAVGVMTTMMTSATTAEAVECKFPPNVTVCPPGTTFGGGGFVVTPSGDLIIIGPR